MRKILDITLATIISIYEILFRAILTIVCLSIGVCILLNAFKISYTFHWWIPIAMYIAFYLLSERYLIDINYFKIRAGIIDGVITYDEIGPLSSNALGNGDLNEYAKQRSMGM